MERGQPQRIDELLHVARLIPEVVALRRRLGAELAPQIDGDHVEVVTQ